jgi:hypothetical protein
VFKFSCNGGNAAGRKGLDRRERASEGKGKGEGDDDDDDPMDIDPHVPVDENFPVSSATIKEFSKDPTILWRRVSPNNSL